MKYVFVILILFNVACSGSSLTGVADTNLTADQKTVIVNVLHEGSSTFDNDLGLTVTLSEASLDWGHVILISGGDDEECEEGHDVTLHVETEEDLLTPELTMLNLGTETINDYAYCGYRIELEGFHLAGSVFDGVTTTPFDITVEDEIAKEADFMASHEGVTIPHPLHYHEGQVEKEIAFVNEYSHWFDGIDFSESADELQVEIIANLKSHLGQYFSDAH
ncbi:hypothetical protein K1X76_08520 [bacterium]|nr:hypothetical protein [bacterium]